MATATGKDGKTTTDQAAGSGEKGLGDIWNLLDENLTEMRTYAFVK
jgi:hypothetical protein